jgi:hypothetical protein
MLIRTPLGGAWRIAVSLSVFAVIVVLGGTADAAPQNGLNPGQTLQDLINLNATGGVRIGNLIFSDFSYSGNPSPNAAPGAGSIDVTTSPYSGTGLEFVAGWQGFTGGDQESLISYAIQAAPGFILTGVQLDFNGAALVVSPGTKASVIETVNTLAVNGSGNPTGAGTPIEQLTVVNTQSSGSVGPQTILEDVSSLPSVQAGLFVQKDIQLNGGTNGVSSISFVANTYQVAVGSVPEPTSTCLLGVVATGLLARRRRA